jgi:hypothetical protein
MSSREDEEEVVELTVDRYYSYGSGGDVDTGTNAAICSFAISAIPGNGMVIPEFGRDIPGNLKDVHDWN